MVSQHAFQVVSSMPCRSPRGCVSQHASLQVSRPILRWELEGSGWGDLQAHTRWVCIPACTEADPPPPPPHTHLTATAAGSTHPTGVFFPCVRFKIKTEKTTVNSIRLALVFKISNHNHCFQKNLNVYPCVSHKLS